MKKSVLETAFSKAYKTRLTKAGFIFEEQVTIPGARFRYDVCLTNRRLRILIEIDGHGMGHNSVASLARDARKGNHAQLSGYLFFRLTTKHFRTKKGKRIPGEYADELIAAILDLTGAK